MFTTLGLLAVAMTSTAALLSWLDPSLDVNANSLPSETIMELARAAVAQDVVVQRGRWHEIEVAPDEVPGYSTMLSAVSSSAASGSSPNRDRGMVPQWHFRIDSDGRPTRGVCWLDQQQVDGPSDAIRIALLTKSLQESSVTTAQWFCLRVLVAEINQRAAASDKPLPVIVDDRADRAVRELFETSLP